MQEEHVNSTEKGTKFGIEPATFSESDSANDCNTMSCEQPTQQCTLLYTKQQTIKCYFQYIFEKSGQPSRHYRIFSHCHVLPRAFQSVQPRGRWRQRRAAGKSLQTFAWRIIKAQRRIKPVLTNADVISNKSPARQWRPGTALRSAVRRKRATGAEMAGR